MFEITNDEFLKAASDHNMWFEDPARLTAQIHKRRETGDRDDEVYCYSAHKALEIRSRMKR